MYFFPTANAMFMIIFNAQLAALSHRHNYHLSLFFLSPSLPPLLHRCCVKSSHEKKEWKEKSKLKKKRLLRENHDLTQQKYSTYLQPCTNRLIIAHSLDFIFLHELQALSELREMQKSGKLGQGKVTCGNFKKCSRLFFCIFPSISLCQNLAQFDIHFLSLFTPLPARSSSCIVFSRLACDFLF